jgi:hypothetical protein
VVQPGGREQGLRDDHAVQRPRDERREHGGERRDGERLEPGEAHELPRRRAAGREERALGGAPLGEQPGGDEQHGHGQHREHDAEHRESDARHRELRARALDGRPELGHDVAAECDVGERRDEGGPCVLDALRDLRERLRAGLPELGVGDHAGRLGLDDLLGEDLGHRHERAVGRRLHEPEGPRDGEVPVDEGAVEQVALPQRERTGALVDADDDGVDHVARRRARQREGAAGGPPERLGSGHGHRDLDAVVALGRRRGPPALDERGAALQRGLRGDVGERQRVGVAGRDPVRDRGDPAVVRGRHVLRDRREHALGSLDRQQGRLGAGRDLDVDVRRRHGLAAERRLQCSRLALREEQPERPEEAGAQHGDGEHRHQQRRLRQCSVREQPHRPAHSSPSTSSSPVLRPAGCCAARRT